MTAKRKISTTLPEPTAAARKSGAKIRVLAPEWSELEIDQRWEQIRLRGEQISADIKALRDRVCT